MKNRNPYAISFGKIPNQYINRDVLINKMIDTLDSDVAEEQAFKLTGIRGTGKTVTLSALEKNMRQKDRWIVVDLKSNSSITEDLVANLYSEVPFLMNYIDTSLNLSAFGIGLNLSKKSPIASIDSALKLLLREIKKRKKRVLVVIDEIRKTDAIIDFIQEFQILIREDLPIFLMVAGLYDDIENVENSDGLTFFLRATKYEMTPLNIERICTNYKETLSLSQEAAFQLAEMTKGYAFAYQAFGKYMWDFREKELTDRVLAQVDETLCEKIYEKIWNELTPLEQEFLRYVVQKESLPAEERLQVTKHNLREWMAAKRHLTKKGILEDAHSQNSILRLPRFKNFLEQIC